MKECLSIRQFGWKNQPYTAAHHGDQTRDVDQGVTHSLYRHGPPLSICFEAHKTAEPNGYKNRIADTREQNAVEVGPESVGAGACCLAFGLQLVKFQFAG